MAVLVKPYDVTHRKMSRVQQVVAPFRRFKTRVAMGVVVLSDPHHKKRWWERLLEVFPPRN
jgi:hypothetical protein